MPNDNTFDRTSDMTSQQNMLIRGEQFLNSPRKYVLLDPTVNVSGLHPTLSKQHSNGYRYILLSTDPSFLSLYAKRHFQLLNPQRWKAMTPSERDAYVKVSALPNDSQALAQFFACEHYLNGITAIDILLGAKVEQKFRPDGTPYKVPRFEGCVCDIESFSCFVLTYPVANFKDNLASLSPLYQPYR